MSNDSDAGTGEYITQLMRKVLENPSDYPISGRGDDDDTWLLAEIEAGRQQQIAEYLEFAVSLVEEAGVLALHYFNSPRNALGIRVKAEDDTLVTQADTEIEAAITTRIRQRFPTHSVEGEEFPPFVSAYSSSNPKWVIDPIDGTYAFVHGMPTYGIMVAFMQDDDVWLSAVHFPSLKKTVYSSKGHGSFCNGERLAVSNTTTLDQALLLTSNIPSPSPSQKDADAEFWTLYRLAKETRSWGDCYGHYLVAAGFADVLIDLYMGLTDNAPLMLIISEAGGTYTNYAGDSDPYATKVIITNGHLFNEVLATIKSSNVIGV